MFKETRTEETTGDKKPNYYRKALLIDRDSSAVVVYRLECGHQYPVEGLDVPAETLVGRDLSCGECERLGLTDRREACILAALGIGDSEVGRPELINFVEHIYGREKSKLVLARAMVFALNTEWRNQAEVEVPEGSLHLVSWIRKMLKTLDRVDRLLKEVEDGLGNSPR